MVDKFNFINLRAIDNLPLNLQGLKSIELGTNNIINKINNLQKSNQPIEILQLPLINIIIPKPIIPVGASTVLMHDRDQKSAQIIPSRNGRPKQSHGSAPHALRRLIVEKLKMADGHERLGHPMQAVLRHEPEHRNGDGGARAVGEAMGEGGVLALPFDEAGYEGGEDGDDEADAHALEEGDAAVEAGESAGDGDEDAVV